MTSPADRRLRLCGVLVLFGLLTALLSLLWLHPTAFLVLVFVAGPLVLAGSLLFLYFLLTILPPAQ